MLKSPHVLIKSRLVSALSILLSKVPCRGMLVSCEVGFCFTLFLPVFLLRCTDLIPINVNAQNPLAELLPVLQRFFHSVVTWAEKMTDY